MLIRKWEIPLPLDETAELLEQRIPFLYWKKRRREGMVRFTVYDGERGRKHTARLICGRMWERDGRTWITARPGVFYGLLYFSIFATMAATAVALVRQGGQTLPILVSLALSVLFLWLTGRHGRDIRRGLLELRKATDTEGEGRR